MFLTDFQLRRTSILVFLSDYGDLTYLSVFSSRSRVGFFSFACNYMTYDTRKSHFLCNIMICYINDFFSNINFVFVSDQPIQIISSNPNNVVHTQVIATVSFYRKRKSDSFNKLLFYHKNYYHLIIM